MKKNSLTFKYTLNQILYSVAVGAVVSFAAAYLNNKGFSSAHVGIILFAGYTLSFIVQPILASVADRIGSAVLPKFMVIISLISAACFLTAWKLNLSVPVFSVLYVIGILCLDMQMPLLNALNVHYTIRSWKINYGLSRGLGGIGYAIATFLYGQISAKVGIGFIPLAAVIIMITYACVALTYPKDDKNISFMGSGETRKDSSLAVFTARYKWYVISLAGILLLAVFHAMAENYLINIFERLGGNSSNVGVALSWATLIQMPAMTFFPYIHKKLGSGKILNIAGIFYTVKGISFIFATSVGVIYCTQTLQIVTYAFLSTVQMYYAKECTSSEDMVKGQSFITAAFTLGSAVGNLLGGSLITAVNVTFMLVVATAIALAGLAILVFAVPKAEKAAECIA